MEAQATRATITTGADLEVIKGFVLEPDDDPPCASGHTGSNNPLCIVEVKDLNFSP